MLLQNMVEMLWGWGILDAKSMDDVRSLLCPPEKVIKIHNTSKSVRVQ
jgi:hypothetical protein